jgi:hypothetical protein
MLVPDPEASGAKNRADEQPPSEHSASGEVIEVLRGDLIIVFYLRMGHC